MGVADDGKKLKNAEQLIQHTSYRLTGILNAASAPGPPGVAGDLETVGAGDELMMQVFKK